MEPIPLLSSLTYPHKANGTLRVCLDPKDLNKSIIFKHHEAPTLEEITHKLAGSNIYIHLTHKSSPLTTFNMYIGRYSFIHMPFTLKMSQDVFHMKINQIVERCQAVLCILDDLHTYRHLEKEHDTNFLNLMWVTSNSSLVFNSRKSQIKYPQLTFYSTIFSKEGLNLIQRKLTKSQRCPPHMYNYNHF